MVLQHHLADPTNVSHDVGYIIADDEVLMAFPSTDLMSTLGVLQRGDNVDIFASMTVEVSPTNHNSWSAGQLRQQQTITRMFTFDAFQRVQISAIVADVIAESGSSTTLRAGTTHTEPGEYQGQSIPAGIECTGCIGIEEYAGCRSDL